ncbi:MAG: Ig-like domain-containing protein [Tahibacter sp.]
MHRSLLAAAIACALSAPVYATEAQVGQPPAVDANIPLTYVGSNARASFGINENGDLSGEGLGVFGFDGDSAWIAQLWLAEHGAGGLQFDYHWLWGGKTRQDTIDHSDGVRVAKAFVAVDQNVWDDRKATVGVGYQKNDFFLDTYVSASMTGNRFVSRSSTQVINNLSGVENGHSYTQTETITTLTDAFEHPYEKGVGVRLGSYFDGALVRVRGGLDYERGRYSSDQLTLSLGVDKYLDNSGWSFTLEGEQLKKSGDFERDKSDTRGWLFARYEFGQSFRAREPYRMVQVERATPVAAPAAPPMQVVRNEIRLDGDAFFDFDHSELRPDAVSALDTLLAKLNSNSRVSRISVVGHTDSIGTDAYNQALSERRAASARAYLIAHGVDATQIDTRGDGERNPEFPNDTKQNRQKNRRVDVDFLTVEEISQPGPAPPPVAGVEWRKEPVAAPAAWIERALRNPAQHKRTVDVYRFERASSSSALGPKQFANRPPDARDDALALAQNASATSIAVLANDIDPDGDPLTITAVSAASHGTASLAGGVVSYAPAAGYTGVDSFTYTISDGFGGTDTATVAITVGAANRPPVAQNDSAVASGVTPVRIAVLANDSDPDGDALTLQTVGTPAHGAAVKNTDGSVSYTANAGYVGSDSFSYTISDGHGGSATAQVSVAVSGAGNRPPVAVDDEVVLIKGTGIDINVLGNDSDPDGDRLRVIEVSHNTFFNVDLSINPDGTIRYVHHHGTQGIDWVTYTISDDHGHTATARVKVVILQLPGDP